jgi:hypothetical protein
MNSICLLIFLGLNKSENKILIRTQCQARSGPGLQPMGCGGLPRGPVDKLARPWPGGLVQPRKWPTELAGGKLLSVSSRGPQGGHWECGRGRAHLNRGAAWRRWRSLGTMAFIGGERAPMAGGDGGTALQCRCRRGKVRAASIGDNGGGWEGLTVKRQRWWHSDRNQRGGGVSGGGSQRGGHIGGGVGGGAQAQAWSRGERRKKGAGGGWWLFKCLGGAGQRGEKGWRPCGCGRVAEGERGEGAPGAVVGSAGWLATASDR